MKFYKLPTKRTMTAGIKEYKHAWLIIAYMIFYLLSFVLLEKYDLRPFRLIHCSLDQYIPYCRYFVIPYMIWFPYVAIAFLYFILQDQKGYYALTKNICFGMTIFIIVSWVFPNRLFIRPTQVDISDIFGRMVRYLYAIDTATNVFPSIHVFNTIAIQTAIHKSDTLRNRKCICIATDILGISIILSTMLIKQHSVLDVTAGLLMGLLGYEIFYKHSLGHSYDWMHPAEALKEFKRRHL